MKYLSSNSLPFRLYFVKYSKLFISYIRHKFKKSFFLKEKVFYRMRVASLFSLPVYHSPNQISIQERKFGILKIIVGE